MSLATLRDLIWAHKPTFFMVFLLVFGATFAFCALVTPIYRSEALVMISQGQTHADQAQFPDTLRYQINSQLYVIESDAVLRPAIAATGPRVLFPDLERSKRSQSISDIDQALMNVKKRFAVYAEKDSQVVWLGFRHENKQVAQQFLDLVVEGFVRRQLALSGNTNAPSFFRDQVSRYRADYAHASLKLNAFAKERSIYSVRTEIRLALKRRDEAKAALAQTSGSVAENEAQVATLQNTLSQLRRRISLPGEIVGPKVAAPPGADPFKDNKVPANESPLLLVKVFQETAQTLVTLQSRVAGFRALEVAETNEVAKIEQNLVRLSSDEAEFVRLQSEVDQAAKILEAYIGRAADAQTNADLEASEQLSRVKVIQSATLALEPVYPPKPLFLTLGAAVGILAGAAASIARGHRGPVLPPQLPAMPEEVSAAPSPRFRTAANRAMRPLATANQPIVSMETVPAGKSAFSASHSSVHQERGGL